MKYPVIILLICLLGWSQQDAVAVHESSATADELIQKKKKRYRLPDIDLSHWKVTIPEGVGKGGAISVSPPDILDYATNEQLLPYMYNDSSAGALTFYAYPSNATTANTKYSRSELREQMEPGNDNVNWTFKDGGRLKAKIAMKDVSTDKTGKYHKVIILQIHGRLTNEQRDLIGQKDNNAPPILKVYWQTVKFVSKPKCSRISKPQEMVCCTRRPGGMTKAEHLKKRSDLENSWLKSRFQTER